MVVVLGSITPMLGVARMCIVISLGGQNPLSVFSAMCALLLPASCPFITIHAAAAAAAAAAAGADADAPAAVGAQRSQ
jgi:hypothetical protein